LTDFHQSVCRRAFFNTQIGENLSKPVKSVAKKNQNMLITFLLCTILTISKVEWLSPTSHDFGTIQKGVPQTHIFEFKNTSIAPIIIDNVRTDCGCTATDWEETPVSMGEKGKITITYDSRKTGYFKKKITVWLHGQRQCEKLWIEGEVE
jgi:Protein of unknown function (DUF1573)